MTLMSPEKGSQVAQTQSDVWQELFGTVAFLSEAVELSIQALSPDNAAEKVVSATTKKRLYIKSLQSLRLGRENIQVLQEHLKALQAASQQWQKTMMYASKSHEELMEQLESTNRDLHVTTERLRSVEAQHLAAVREGEAQRQHILNIESAHRELQATLKQKEDELETAQFVHEELRSHMEQLSSETAAAKAGQAAAERERDRAVAALDGVRAEADKALAATQRHQETVAKLTADNLVFVMNLKKAEADLAEATADKSLYKLAAEKQRGPWFDEVRASVEERVRNALSRAEGLEAEMEALKKQHATQLQDLMCQKSDLEEFLSQLRTKEEELEQQVSQANSARTAAEGRAAAAMAAQAQAEQVREELAMRNSVLQDSVKAMRQECTERWVSEQAALGKVSGLESGIASLERLRDELTARCGALEGSLEGQAAVNRQLMQRKEQVEWQLMAALAKSPQTSGLEQPVPTLPQPAHPPAARATVPSASPARVRPDVPSFSTPAPARPVQDISVPRRTASEFYGSPARLQSLQPTAPSPPRPVSAAHPSAAHSAYASPARPPPQYTSSQHQSRSDAIPSARTSNAQSTFPAPSDRPMPTSPDINRPSREPSTPTATVAQPETDATKSAAAPAGLSSSNAGSPERSPTPHYRASSSGIVPIAALSHGSLPQSMPPKALRTSAVLLEQQQQPQHPAIQAQQPQVPAVNHMPADAFNIMRPGATAASRQPSLPSTAQHPLFASPTHASQASPEQQMQVQQKQEPVLQKLASLSSGIAPNPASASPAQSPPVQRSQNTNPPHDARHSHGTLSPTVSASPLARDSPPALRAAQGMLPPGPVYHPAMHPSLLVQPTAAARADELSLGGGTGRRISAASFTTTTPPPKTRPQ